MNYAVVAAKIDQQTKRQAMKTASELGMPLSVIIKAFLKQFIRTKSISFSAVDEIPNEYLQNIMRTAHQNLREGKHSPILRTPEEAVRHLEKQGI